MFHGGAKYSTETLKCPTEVLNIPRRLSNVPRVPAQCPPGEQSANNDCQWQIHAELPYQDTSNAPCTVQNKLQHTTRITVVHLGPLVDIHIGVRTMLFLWASNLVRRDFLVVRQSCQQRAGTARQG